MYIARPSFYLPLTLASKGLAVSFARAGAKALYLIARSQSGLEETRQLVKCTNSDVKVILKSMSVTDESAAKELFEQIRTDYGKADVLLNCAGVGSGGDLLTAPIDATWKDFVSPGRGYSKKEADVKSRRSTLKVVSS